MRNLLERDVDVVVCDEQFGRDVGESFAAEVKRMKPEMPVLLLGLTSGNAQNADRVVQPSVEPEVLLTEIELALREKPRVGPEALLPAEQSVPGFPVDSEPETLRSLLAEIVESSEDAILSKTLDGTVTSWNHAAEQMFGYSAKEIVGRNVALLLPPDRPNEVHEILVKLQRGERIEHFETRRKTKDGRILDVSLSVSPIRNRRDRIIGASTITRDITQLKLAERALRNTEKLAVAGRMAATVAHEINNPLEAIANIFYLLKQDRSLGELAKQFIHTGEEELRRITQITRLTLGFHRDRLSTVTEVAIPDLIDNVLTLFQRKVQALGVHVTRRYESSGRVRGNSGELRQVFSNLVVNAIDALSNRGDRLMIRVRDVKRRGVEGVLVSVADNGPGISVESRKRLFEPFFTTKGAKGTGIGLWVSQGIVEKHGGVIRLRSRAGRNTHGTIFSVFLPHDAAQVSGKSKEEKRTEPMRRAS